MKKLCYLMLAFAMFAIVACNGLKKEEAVEEETTEEVVVEEVIEDDVVEETEKK